MYLHLGDLAVELSSPDPAVHQAWQRGGQGFLTPSLPAGQPHLTLQLHTAPTIDPPAGQPIFHHPQNLLDVYPGPLLYFPGAARVQLPPLEAEGLPVVQGVVTAAALVNGRLEDIIFTSLAPLLRRRGYFLAHAFAAGREGEAALLVGPSGSGKTTTGLRLVLQGWTLLANDVVLLQHRPDGVYALPTPGEINIRRPTLALLPQLAGYVDQDSGALLRLRREGMLETGREHPPQRIARLYFLRLAREGELGAIRPENTAIALARLLEESADRWDTPTLPAHLACLQQLSEQAGCYRWVVGEGWDADERG